MAQKVMADSVYISQNLTGEQLRFLQLMDEQELLYFSMHDIEEKLGYHFKNLNEVLENLVNKKILARIEKGKFRRTTFSDIYVLASFISNGGIISYWSALHLHGLTERFPNKVFIKTSMRKRNTKILETLIQFVSVKESKMQGVIQQGYGDSSYLITDKECTIIDCFDQPRYAGDYPDLLKAFAQTNLDAEKLITYSKEYNNIALIKRLGFLAELLNKKEMKNFVSYAKMNKGKKYTLFEPGGSEKGAFRSDWMLRLNRSEEEIVKMLESIY